MARMNWFHKLFQGAQKEADLPVFDKKISDSKKELPDSPNFAELINKNYIYVDKTDLIAKFVHRKGPFFLARPRRFGKSTLISTLHELFANGLTQFKDLKFEKAYEEFHMKPWSNETYKVIHLDFSVFKNVCNTTVEQFQQIFNNQLIYAMKNVDIPISDTTCDYPPVFLDNSLLKAKEQYVLLIDEYDAPLTATYGDPEKFEAIRRIIADFYATIKAHIANFRFVFITGICYYAHASIFSEGSNIVDLTLDHKYGALLGYTRQEIEDNFGEYLDNAVEVLKTIRKSTSGQEYTRASLMEDLKRHYDGYSFDEKCQHHVYNPWSIVNFLANPDRAFQSYWYYSGSFMPTMLIRYIKNVLHSTSRNHDDNLLIQNSEELSFLLDVDATCVKNADELLPRVENLSTIDPFAILYQAGYFTIKSASPDYENEFTIGLPNLEVRKAYSKILVKQLLSSTDNTIRTYRDICKNCLTNCDLQTLQRVFSELVNELSYESIRTFNELKFRDFFKVVLLCFELNPATEVMSAFGRIDLTVSVGKYLYVIEMKLAHKEADIEKKLAEAKQQIIDRKYAVRATPLTVVALAMVINNNSAVADASLKPIVKIEQVAIPQT